MRRGVPGLLPVRDRGAARFGAASVAAHQIAPQLWMFCALALDAALLDRPRTGRWIVLGAAGPGGG